MRRNKKKPISVATAYRKMYPFVKPYLFRAVVAMLATIPVGAMDAGIAYLLRPFTDTVLVEKSLDTTLTLIPIIIVLVGLTQGAFNYFSTYMNAWVGAKITNDLKMKLYDKLLSFDAVFYDKKNSGDIQFRFHNDADLACSGLIGNVKTLITRVFSTIALFGVMFYNSWQLSIIAIFIVVGVMYPLSTLRKRINSIMSKSIASMSALVKHYNEAFFGSKVIGAYNLRKRQNKIFRDTTNNIFQMRMKMTQRTGILTPTIQTIASIGIAAVIWYGSYLIMQGTITSGAFVSFLASLMMLYTPLKGMGNTYSGVVMAVMAIERVFEMLSSEPTIKNREGAKELNEAIKSIEYKEVSFSYDGKRKALDNISVKIDAGTTVALVGNSGGGKTTFVSLLARFYDVTSGKILIDGVDIRDIDLTSLRDHISIVFQDNYLFDGTIRENVTLGNEASDEEVMKAVKSACLEEFIAELKEGLNTKIGERGVLLSGGQKQRVAIARAFLKNSQLVILDEATSALDNESEAVVRQAISNLMKNRTVIVIAHRLSTVQNADKIIVVNRGKIAEIGTHKELLAQEKSVYSALYQSQFKEKTA
ncbi:MAG: ABC transporter ATP-binding protein/permease [Helicobacteraceae bacterium]|jgi:subfamily B ATP-binding cassette protein MsbA|nr:ABC transporter ATP-binding protein/permease [Helicobacteraceae bacterium]